MNVRNAAKLLVTGGFAMLGLRQASVAQGTPADAVATTGAVTVRGNHLLRDGVPWIPHGVMMVAFVAPPAVQHGVFTGAYAHYSADEMAGAKAWGADVVRFQVSQPGTDPQNPLYTTEFVEKVRGAVLASRAAGLDVIVEYPGRGRRAAKAARRSCRRRRRSGYGRCWGRCSKTTRACCTSC